LIPNNNNPIHVMVMVKFDSYVQFTGEIPQVFLYDLLYIPTGAVRCDVASGSLNTACVTHEDSIVVLKKAKVWPRVWMLGVHHIRSLPISYVGKLIALRWWIFNYNMRQGMKSRRGRAVG
jgi:hypothetical protein